MTDVSQHINIRDLGGKAIMVVLMIVSLLLVTPYWHANFSGASTDVSLFVLLGLGCLVQIVLTIVLATIGLVLSKNPENALVNGFMLALGTIIGFVVMQLV